MKYRLSNISGGEAGTDQTVRAIGELIQSSIKRQKIRIFTISLLDRANVSSHNPRAVVHVVYSWVKKNIRYVQDPIDLETIQDPEITLRLKAGDCDDHSALVSAMLESVGIRTRLKVVGDSADNFVHIYPEALAGGRWVAVDTSVRSPFGTGVDMLKKKYYNSRGDVMNSLAYGGLGRSVAPVEIPVSLAEIQAKFYRKVQQVLRHNWNTGQINIIDVRSYIRVIDEGNSPSRGTIAEPPMRKAIADFLRFIEKSNIQSAKPLSSMNGMEGVNGFLKSIWNGIKSVAKGVVGVFTGGGGAQQIVIQPPVIKLPESLIKTEVTPDAARAGIAAMMSNPLLWVALAGLIIMVVKK